MDKTDAGASYCATVLDVLRPFASACSDVAALDALDRSPLTYRPLLAVVFDIVRALRGRGLEKGDTVAIVLPDGPDLATAFLAVSATAIAAPLNPRYQAAEFEFFLHDLNVRAVIAPDAGTPSPVRDVACRIGIPVMEVHRASAAGSFHLTGPGIRARVPRSSGATSSDDVALALYTSGTTARPKIVPLTHRNLITSAANVGRALSLGPKDRSLTIMPLFHIHGIVAGVLAPLAAGGTAVCAPGFNGPRFLDWLGTSRATWFTAAPSMHQAIVARATERSRTFADLRFIRSSSAPLPAHVRTSMEEIFGVPVVEAYGMTEAAHQIASNPLPPGRRKPRSVGLPAGPDVTIIDDVGVELPPGVSGEIAIRGANVVSGYLRAGEANTHAFINGWFRTGDLGWLDEDGYVYIGGRLKELINRAGEKIAPAEVDEVLLEHAAVAQAVTFGVPDERLGEEVAAAVALRDGMTVSGRELRLFAAERLAIFKVPRTIHFVAEIPKGATGKVQRIELASTLAASVPPAHAPESRVDGPTPLESMLAGMCARLLDVESIGASDDFFERGGDSLLATQLVAQVSDALGIDLSIVDFLNPDGVTLANFARAIDAVRHAGPLRSVES